jgi:hypothetical protein
MLELNCNIQFSLKCYSEIMRAVDYIPITRQLQIGAQCTTNNETSRCNVHLYLIPFSSYLTSSKII